MCLILYFTWLNINAICCILCHSRLLLAAEDMNALFAPSVDHIIATAGQMVARADGVDAILLVGGFSASPYAMHCIRIALEGPGRAVIAPTYGPTAVLEGTCTIVKCMFIVWYYTFSSC